MPVATPARIPLILVLPGNTPLHPDVTSCQTDVRPPPELLSVLPARSDVYSFTLFATSVLTLVPSLLPSRGLLGVATHPGPFRLSSRHSDCIRNPPTLP